MDRRRILGLAATGAALVISLGLGLALFRYSQLRGRVPTGVSAAGVALGGLSQEQAEALLQEEVAAPLALPVQLRYLGELVPLLPSQVGFQVDVVAMAAEAIRLSEEADRGFWAGFLGFLMGQEPLGLQEVPLATTIDEPALRGFLIRLGQERDRPLRPVTAITNSYVFDPGQSSQTLDVAASFPKVVSALTRVGDRSADLVVLEEHPQPPPLSDLVALAEHRVQEFPGIVGVYVMDLSTGEAGGFNEAVVFSGMSLLKLGVMLQTLIDFNGEALTEGMTNLMWGLPTDPGQRTNELLAQIGRGDAVAGARRVTATLADLGLIRTVILWPYRIETAGGAGAGRAAPRPDLLELPLGQDTNPDPFIQTTPEEIVRLLAMIYGCAQDEGTLRAAYPERLSPDDCQFILEVLKTNPIGTWIRSGIPTELPFAHKHGFSAQTIADAGIVFSPGGDYAIAIFAFANVSWLGCYPHPVFYDISRAAYGYFNLGSGPWEPPAPACF